MPDADLHVVTGAFGYSGRHIAQRLLGEGKRVRTLTGHPERPNPFGERVAAHPFNFDEPGALVESLRGADVLYNTYWIRFPRGDMTFERAIENTMVLLRAAQEAGVRRIVHLSVTNPSTDSPWPYFRGKAVVEDAIRASGISYAILRPALLFGGDDVLINNIAWMLRHLPVFAVFGDGKYKLQPIHVDDLAKLAVDLGAREDNVVTDAIGPETFAFGDLVRTIKRAIGSRALIVHTPVWPVMLLTKLIGYATGDVVLTRDEVEGLMRGMLATDSPPSGKTRLTDWLRENADTIGRRYGSELRRRHR
jgi:uncharacterized protein YbjT (DUF2867 family)